MGNFIAGFSDINNVKSWKIPNYSISVGHQLDRVGELGETVHQLNKAWRKTFIISGEGQIEGAAAAKDMKKRGYKLALMCR